jgi:hypothetical protein
MDTYYVNKNEKKNGDHEVHRHSCESLPEEKDLESLGAFPTCQEAVKKAKKIYPKIDGSAICCKTCHKG